MHENLARYISNRFSKLSDDLVREHAAAQHAQRERFARNGTLESGVFQHAEVTLYLQFATKLCEGRANIWADAITEDQGKFTSEDVAFIEEELAGMIAAHRGHAERVMRDSGADSSMSSFFVQMIGAWVGGLRGPIRRELEYRLERAVLDEKVQARRQAAEDLAEAPRILRWTFGRWAARPFVAGSIVVGGAFFTVIGFLASLKEVVSWFKSP